MIEFAHAADAAAATQNFWVNMIPWIGIVLVMWFMMIRPHQKREKERQAMISQLKKGDRVLLMSGFYGKVVKAGESIFTIELGKGLQVEVERNAIAALANHQNENAQSTTEDNKSE